MTDPDRRAFVIYSRRRADEAGLIVEALHEHGIPTWQDIRDLRAEPTEAAIRTTLGAPETACAVMLLTPEVEDSTFIRNIEAAAAFEHQQNDPNFFVVPVAAGGLDHAAAARVLDSSIAPATLAGWNILAAATNPIDRAAAAAVARRVLTQRLGILHTTLPTDDPLTIGLHTFPTGARLPAHLRLEWAHAFEGGRFADPGVWQHRLVPALEALSATIGHEAPGRAVLVQGGAALSSAIALGRTLASTTGTDLRCRQVFPDGSQQIWSPREPAEPFAELQLRTDDADHASTHLAVLISIVHSADAALDAGRPDLPPFRGIIRAASPAPLALPGHAVTVVDAVRDAIIAARRRYGTLTDVHVFMAGPLGLAVLLGRRLTSVGTVHLYEFNQAASRYVPSAVLR